MRPLYGEVRVNDRRVLGLLYALVTLSVLNFGTTLYFQFARPSGGSSAESASSEPSIQVAEKEAIEFARGIVDLYNDNKFHELYLRFEDLARVQFSEQKLTEDLAKLHAVVGKIEQFAYSNTEVAGKDSGRTYLALNYKARLSGGAWNPGTIRITVSRKDGRLGLYGFNVGTQTN